MQKDKREVLTPFVCYLPRDLYLLLRKTAFDKQVSMSEAIREALRETLLKPQR